MTHYLPTFYSIAKVSRGTLKRWFSSTGSRHVQVSGETFVKCTSKEITIDWEKSKKSDFHSLNFYESSLPSKFHLVWLRDHCRCPQCYHQKTYQRIFDPGVMNDLKVTAKQINVLSSSLEIIWEDRLENHTIPHKSLYPFQFLLNHDYSTSRASSRLALVNKYVTRNRVLWDSSLISTSPPSVHYGNVMKYEQGDFTGLKDWLKNIATFGFSLVQGVPKNIQATEKLLNSICFVRETHYGKMWDFQPNLAFGDTAYTSDKLLPHTDNTYFTDPAGLQLLHPIEYEATGGESVLVDGFYCAQQLFRNSPDKYKTLCTLPVDGDYIDDKGFYFRARGYVLKDPSCNFEKLSQVRFNNNDRTTLDYLSYDQVQLFYEAWQEYFQIITNPSNVYKFLLQPGTALIFHNHRVLHGRDQFSGHRRVVGGYLNNDDYLSRLKTLMPEYCDK